MLHLQEFIKQNQNWEELLSMPLYNISIKRKNGLVLFKYGVGSDFTNEIVRECRGLILEDKTFRVVACPFFKFGNYGEGYVPEIDWTTARVQEKIDGSLIVLSYYNGKWNVSTTGCVDAADADLPNNLYYHNFKDLFMFAATNPKIGDGILDFTKLNIDNTYMFELVSPYNHVVINYYSTKIYHIGTRNNITLQELDEDIGITKPRLFEATNLDECIKLADKFKGHEGFVVVDRNWNRIKVKNPEYVMAHHAVNNHQLTLERIIDIKDNYNEDEFLTYFPEYEDCFWDITLLTDCFLSDVQDILDKLDGMIYNNRKEIAKWLVTTDYPQAGFMYLDDKISNSVDYYNSLTTNKKAEFIKKYKPKYI